MGYKICTPGVQNFLGYRIVKWGTVPRNGVQLAALIYSPVLDGERKREWIHLCFVWYHLWMISYKTMIYSLSSLCDIDGRMKLCLKPSINKRQITRECLTLECFVNVVSLENNSLYFTHLNSKRKKYLNEILFNL